MFREERNLRGRVRVVRGAFLRVFPTDKHTLLGYCSSYTILRMLRVKRSPVAPMF